MSRSSVRTIGLLAALILLGLAWNWLAARDILTVETLRQYVSIPAQLRDSGWLLPVIMAGYALALLAMFPLTLLVGVTGLLFGPVWGFAYATAGTLTSSVASYWVGRWLGKDTLRRHGGPRLRLASRYFAKRGIRTMTLINLLPLAPFTLTNMMAGAFHLRFRDYMIGSTLGIVPGLAAVTLLGSQLGALILATGDDAPPTAWILAGIAAAVAALVSLQLIVRRRARQIAGPDDAAPSERRRIRVSGARKR